MSQNDVLRDKMNSLNTLSSGIVFGKEEAWDKLQARMDKPAKKVIPLRFWIAAAAILLLMVTIFIALNVDTTVQEVAINSLPPKAAEKDNVIAPQRRPAATGSTVVVTTHNTTHTHPVRKTEEQAIQQQPAKTEELQQVAEITHVSENEKIIVNAPSETASKIPTKVMHINDLAAGSVQQDEPLGSAAAGIYPAQVIHLNDLKDHQVKVNHYLQQQKDFVVSLPWLDRSSENTPAPVRGNESRASGNILKFKLN